MSSLTWQEFLGLSYAYFMFGAGFAGLVTLWFRVQEDKRK